MSTAIWISTIALVISLASLLWQVGRYRLEGPRLKVLLNFAQWRKPDGGWTRSVTISVQNHGRYGVLVESVVLVGPENFGSVEEPEQVWHGGDPTQDGSHWIEGQSAIVVERSLSDVETWLRKNAAECCAVFVACSTSVGKHRYSRPVLVWADLQRQTKGRPLLGWRVRYGWGRAMAWWGPRRDR